MAQSNVSIKVWRNENIVRDQELVPLQGELYDSIEGLTGLDNVDQIDLSRPMRNMFEDQQNMFNFLANLALGTKENSGVFKNSLEHQLDVQYTLGASVTGDDFVPVTLSSVYEQWEYEVTISSDISDLENEYIEFEDPSANQYYIWYNLDGGGTDPEPFGVGVGTAIEINVVTGESVDDVAQNTVAAINGASIPFNSNFEGATVKVINEEAGNAVDATSTYFSVTVTTQGAINLQQYYARIKPGIAFVDGTIVVVKPNLYVAERLIEKIYGLQPWQEKGGFCSILYSYEYDQFHMRIRINEAGTLNDYDFTNGETFGTFAGGGYNSSASLFTALYTNPQIGYQFAFAVSDSGEPDFTKLSLEPLAKLTLGPSHDLYWSIRKNGDLEYNTSSIGGDGIDLYYFEYSAGGGSITVNSATDSRPFYQNFNDFEGNIYLNVPDSWNTSDTSSSQPWDPTDSNVTYEEVSNATTLITIFRQHTGNPAFTDESFEAGSVVFGWVEGRLAVYDPHGVIPDSDSYKDQFYINKDLLVQWGDSPGEYSLFSDIATVASAGFPVEELYSDLAGINPKTDATVAFVQETNQFYRYAESAGSFIPVSDPHKQFWGQVARTDGVNGQALYQFNGIVWRTDGSNIQVFLDGVYQAPNTPGDTDGDYDVESYNEIEFNSNLSGGEQIIVRITEGGEDFQAEKVIYTAGTAENVYTGGLIEYEVPFQMVQQRVDVFKNGSLLREAEFYDTMTEDTGDSSSPVDTITDATKSYSTNALTGYWVFIKNSTNTNIEFIVSKVASNTATTITLEDDLAPDNIVTGTLVEIYTPYDYFVNEVTEIVNLTNAATIGDTIVIRDQAAIVSSYDIQHKGDSFPSFPTFGFSFYRTDLDAWFKYTGDEEENPGEWVQI